MLCASAVCSGTQPRPQSAVSLHAGWQQYTHQLKPLPLALGCFNLVQGKANQSRITF